MTAFTAEQKRDAALRELKKRQSYYPGMVFRERMTREQMNYQIEIMREIAEDYHQQATRKETT